jgi:hypothetical protein
MPDAIPEQSPVQPPNVKPALGVAAIPIVIGAGIVTEQREPPAPQLSPAPVTDPPAAGVIVSV